MFESIYLKNDRLNVDTCRYLRRHDLVFQTPEYKEYNGIPLGTGCFGGLLYHTEDSVRMKIHHTDAVDFAREEDFGAWGWEDEEKNTAQFGCGQLTITDHQPSFDWLYLKEYESRLNIAGAVHTMDSETPFSKWKVKTYASHADQVIVMDVEASAEEACEREVILERWGSRNFFHYYEQMSTDVTKNLSDTNAGEVDGCFYVKQKVGKTSFVTCAKVIGAEHTITRSHSHRISCRIKTEKNVHFTLILTTLINETPEKAAGKLNGIVVSDELYRRHTEDWKEYWEKSFISLPEQDYLENVYYMHLYQLRCTGLGKLPTSFGAIWTWFGDTRNWGHFYHWNYQQTYWPLHACNHAELAENYYEYRFNMLPQAEKFAKKLFGVEGAFFSDIANLGGYQAAEPDTVRNFTPGAEIAMSFYKHYQYTLDEKFLKERAYPFMKACALFYENMLQKEDGVYYIKGGSTAYEAYWNLKATITDYSAIKELFAVLLKVSKKLETDEEKQGIWEDILENLYQMPMRDGLISSGMKWNGECTEFGEGDYPRSTFTCAYFAPVYPHNLIGIAQKGTKEFNAAQATLDRRLSGEKSLRGNGSWCGHTPLIQMAARLGDGRALSLVEDFVESYQSFTNGLCHFISADNSFRGTTYRVRRISEKTGNTVWTELHEKNTGERVSLPADVFNHAYFEASSNITDGINEILMQSYDDVIRVFPAVPENFSGTFTLSATGGFLVTSQMCNGQILYVAIKSQFGGICRVYEPWEGLTEIKDTDFRREKDWIEFQTEKDGVYVLYNREYSLEQYYVDELPYCMNQKAKHLRNVQMGEERNF